MRLKAIRFENYRAFKCAELPLQPLTLLIGPNGSGKTSALSAIPTLSLFAQRQNQNMQLNAPIGVEHSKGSAGSLDAIWDNGVATRCRWSTNAPANVEFAEEPLKELRGKWLASGRQFTFEPKEIAGAVSLTKTLEIHENGAGLPAVLTTLQDEFPERFDALNADLRRWLPEFNRILFDTPAQGQRAIMLRTADGGHKVPTRKLSSGTLLSLALLTLCHLPQPPSILGLEEPDFGLHPRLLRQLKNSLLRLTNPEAFGEIRQPVQVIVTTHSPYMVDLFHDELESIVVIQKEGLHSTFRRVSDLPHVEDILKDAALGDSWYSGVLGGVPVES